MIVSFHYWLLSDRLLSAAFVFSGRTFTLWGRSARRLNPASRFRNGGKDSVKRDDPGSRSG